MSHDQVKLALNLEERFESLPVLHGLLVNGEVSVNKLARVVSIAKPENEEEMVEAVKLSNRALETYVRDEKFTGMHVHDLTLNDEVKFRLAPLCKEHHEIAHAINLKVREKKFANDKCGVGSKARPFSDEVKKGGVTTQEAIRKLGL
ncbi:hypothetical protein HY463_01610 [Candidatus Peregrinibacteria bacterium]|nr:hypothetical protein [Candidatus Peregrinibacteria bacterium]